MSRGKASAIRNGCQLKSMPVSLVLELICVAYAFLVKEQLAEVMTKVLGYSRQHMRVLLQERGVFVMVCKKSAHLQQPTAVGLTETPPKYCHTHTAMRMTVISWIILRFSMHVSRSTAITCRAGFFLQQRKAPSSSHHLVHALYRYTTEPK